MKERGNYGTIGKASHLYIKEIHDDHDNHDGQGSPILISMISPS
jgi:hypothetical protein